MGTPISPVHTTPPRRRRARLIGLGLLVLAGCGSDQPATDATSATSAAVPTSTTSTTPVPDGPTSTMTTTTGPDDVDPPTPTAIWERVAIEGTAPPARSAAVLVAAPDETLWLHGGRVDGAATDELWRFDGARWDPVEPAGPGPSPRFEHVGVWDDDRDRLVITFGQDDTSAEFDEVWAFDPDRETWSLLSEGGPAARYGSCGVIDDQGRLLVTHGFSLAERFDDTWAFDLAEQSWVDVTPSGDPAPEARCLHACAFDPETAELVLFGGRTDREPQVGDTWRLGDDGWRELSGDGPAPRSRPRAVFATGGVHLFGGQDLDGPLADAWRLGDEDWIASPEGPPADRHSHAVAQRDGTAWVFGGAGDAGDLDDLWRLG